MNGVDVKMNELNEKVDEFQLYQMSREVELQRMKIKLDDSMVELNKACGKQIKKKKDEKDEMVKKWNMENRRLKEAQYNLKESIAELKTTVNDIRKEVFNKLNDQQDKINDINQTTEILQKQSEHVTAIFEEKSKEGEEEKEVNEVMNSSLSEKFNTVQQNIDTLNDEMKMLSMETKVMTTNISLIWDDVRTIKNFIDQYDMNDKLKEHETNEEITEIYGQINDLKKKINDSL
jgi:predicted  nucleic acid-binding Zn-ribbon protein